MVQEDGKKETQTRERLYKLETMKTGKNQDYGKVGTQKE